MASRRSSTELDEYSVALAAVIRAERSAQRLTQVELAKAAHLSESTIKRIENEAVAGNTTQLWKIGKALGMSVTQLSDRAYRRMPDEAAHAPRQASSG